MTTRKLAERLREEEAATFVADLSALPVVATDGERARDGIAIGRDARISYCDGLIVAAAKAGGCDTLLSEGLAHGSPIAGVAVQSPFA